MASTETNSGSVAAKTREDLPAATVRFAGDSGDGMQLVGTQFTNSSAIFGNDISTLPDFPAEIRAPAGSLAGVSGFQINFGSDVIHTPGDRVDTLVAMNPAALKTNIGDVVPGGMVVVNSDSFAKGDLSKAGYENSPLDDNSLNEYKVVQIPLSRLNRDNLADTGLGAKIIDRCKNFFALGLVYWLYDRPLDPTLNWIQTKFGKNPPIADANTKSLKAGFHFGETTELLPRHYRVPKATIVPGKYRSIMGNEALAIGLITAATKAGRRLFYGSYPITPASDILHYLSKYKNYNVVTFQAEDEIAAVTATLGAAFGGAFGVTGTSGPGLALKAEAVGLGVMTELPMVVVNVQRGGPSTGLPTKTEQADLLQGMFGRNGECPLPIIAPSSPADCFDTAIEAFRIATRFMIPVLLLSDGYVANGAEPWLIPDPKDIPSIDLKFAEAVEGETFQPYLRNDDLSRPWAPPGIAGLEHRIGGLEKADVTGNVSYDPDNHQHMIETRAKKVENVTRMIPPIKVSGPDSGELLVVGWGGTFGAITAACDKVRAAGYDVSNIHLRHLNPLPSDLGDVLGRFKKVLIPELNMGQLSMLIRSRYLIDAVGLNKVKGKPFMIAELEEEIYRLLEGKG